MVAGRVAVDWPLDAALDSAKGPGMAGGSEAKKLVFFKTSERP